DREVTIYEVLLNSINISTIIPIIGLNNHTTNNMSLDNINDRYSVRAINCAGSSVSNEVVYTPNPPSAPYISISTTYVSSTSCTGTITLTWPAVTSDREVTSYEVLLNGTNISTTTPTGGQNNYTTGVLNLLEHYATYTVVATSCAGSNTSSDVVFNSPTPAIPAAPLLTATPTITLLQVSTCAAQIA
ncbi:hypothetical protein, partial [Salmonella sp. s51228]|uniref:hypothetical protein n=1 Tax=Salmonella sp. s51228 TaxID=3159652 RepID=UPI003981473D